MFEQQLEHRKRAVATQCPHLGLASDPLNRESRVSVQHRCYVGLGRERVDLGHQQRFCLSSSHVRCPFLTVSEPELGLFDQIGAWSRNVSLRDRALALGQLALQTWSAIRPQLMRPIPMPMSMPHAKSQSAAVAALLSKRQVVAAPALLAPAERVQPALPAPHTVVPPLGAPATMVTEFIPLRVTVDREPVPSAAVTEFTSDPVVVDREPIPVVAPQDDVDLVALGIAAIESNDEPRAYALFKRATEREPRDPRTWFWRAKTSETLEEVILCLKQAREFDPDNALIQTNLQWAVDRRDAARAKPTPPPPAPAPTQYSRARSGFNPAALVADLLFTTGALIALVCGGIVFFSALPHQLRTALVSNYEILSTVPVLDTASLTQLVHIPLGGGYDAGMALPYTVAMLALIVGLRLLRADRPFADAGHVSRRTTPYWRS